MAVQFSVLAANAASLVGLGHTRLEVWQSVDSGNSYSEITASAAAAASLESLEASTTFLAGGRQLRLRFDGAPEGVVSFSSLVQFWTPTQVANRINEVFPGRASVSGSKVVLTSATTGRASVVEVTYNDVDELGWAAGLKVYGKMARLVLSPTTFVYLVQDTAGATSHRYKWRFSANGAEPVSQFYGPVSGTAVPLIAAASLSVCSAIFCDASGLPIRTKVIVGLTVPPQGLAGVVVGDPGPSVFESDELGFVQFSLVRGAKVRIAIENTTLVKDVTVPDAASFDLLTLLGSVPDTFAVQQPPPLLTRRSV